MRQVLPQRLLHAFHFSEPGTSSAVVSPFSKVIRRKSAVGQSCGSRGKYAQLPRTILYQMHTAKGATNRAIKQRHIVGHSTGFWRGKSDRTWSTATFTGEFDWLRRSW